MLCVWVQRGRAMSPAYPNVRTALPTIWPASRRRFSALPALPTIRLTRIGICMSVLQEVLPRIGLAAVGLRDATIHAIDARVSRSSQVVDRMKRLPGLD